jgi:DNA-binding MarR family transcriptional regulator
MQPLGPLRPQAGGAIRGGGDRDLGIEGVQHERPPLLFIKLLGREHIVRSSLTSSNIATMMPTVADDRDAVDGKLEMWSRELPDLDLATEGIVARIQHLEKRLKRSMEETLAEFGLDYGEWVVLGALRSAGEPYRRSAGALARVLDLTTGAMTSRLDRMQSAGLVTRVPDPNDRRGVQIEITDRGRALWEDAVGVQAAKEQLVAGALSRTEKEELNALLRRLVLAFESAAAERAA